MKIIFNVSWTGVLKKYVECQRNLFYKQYEKPAETDYVEGKYGRFGNAVHEVHEFDKKYKSLDDNIDYHHKKWNLAGHYTKQQVRDCYDYGQQALKEIGKKILKNEEQLVFQIPEYPGVNFKAIIDMTFEDGSTGDWKTSTYKTKSVNDYIKQGKFYCWCKLRVTGKIPKAFHLIFNKEKKNFEYNFTMEELLEFEKKYIFDVLDAIIAKTKFEEFTFNSPKACYFCPWKKKCSSDNFIKKDDVIFYIRTEKNRVFIDNEFIDPVLENVIDSEFSYLMDNAHHAILAMRKKGNTTFDGVKRLYNRRNKSLPLGFKDYLLELIKGYAASEKLRLTFEFQDMRPKTIDYDFNTKQITKNLRIYQDDALNSIMRKYPICLADICTGAGKTLIAAEMIRRVKKLTLFVIDEKTLMNQSKKVFEDELSETVGVIGGGVYDPQPITVATIQTLVKRIKNKDTEFLKYLRQVGLVIIDEAHGARAKSYKTLFDNVVAKRIVGLTGTAYPDGNEKLELYRSFGFPKINIKTRDLISLGYLTPPKVRFYNYEEDFFPNGDYGYILDKTVLTQRRIDILLYIIKQYNSHKHLIIVSKIEHGDRIKEQLANIGIKSEYIQGKVKAKERIRILKELNEGTLNVVIGTSKIVQKGLDIPYLNSVINTTANLGSTFTIQSIGRILRKADGKFEAIYHDFNDQHAKLKLHTRMRIQQFEKEGYKVEIISDIEQSAKEASMLQF